MKIKLLFTFSAALGLSLAARSQTYKFDFGAGKPQQGYKQVSANSNYNAETGYGFEFSSDLLAPSVKTKTSAQDDYITSSKPFYFSVKLPDGNYNVKVSLGDKNGGVRYYDQSRMQKTDGGESRNC